MKLKYIFTIALLTMFVSSCDEEFLETEPTEFVSVDRLGEISERDPSVQQATLRGVYSLMFTTGSGGTTGHDDFGQKGYDIYTDMLSSDMVLGAKIYGWYANLSDYLATIDYTNNANYMVWRYYYRIINGANIVIDNLGGNDAVPETLEGQAAMGQAKALRAYAYFYLANLMAEGYNPSQEILPIYTSIDQENQALSTTAEVYDLIVSDLTTAIEYLEGYNRVAKFEINQNVARGLLAYAYSAMGNHNDAAALALQVINSGNYQILPYTDVTTDGFNNVNTSSWMWGVDLTIDIGLDLISWWGQADLFTYSYAWAGDGKIINDALYAAIPEEDVRKGQFVNAYGDGQLYPINKFFDEDRVIGGQRAIESDYVFMRIEEMYLLHAENAYKAGDEGAARESLRALLSERLSVEGNDNYVDSYVTSLSGTQLLEEILLQTRIELWGEGKSYLSVKRNQITVEVAPNHLTIPGEEIPYNDDRLTFDIPQSEIQNNPNINF